MMKLIVLPDHFSVLKLDPQEDIPSWVFKNKHFVSVTYTDEELSIVCPESLVPEGLEGEVEQGWRCLKVEGPLDFSLTGILAALANPLAEAGVGIYALSTYNTDYLLVKKEQIEMAIRTLKDAGHQLN